ncbi:hypothetical protein NQ318_007132 [Aromia moschata]|uniref:RHD domain-containing protein n=1 Tax=Aromia moschata TaxID=1265417 RepID=A0AAV8XNA9_9CUCU|nr:hypothetical protein NQ318_007132 [Aromia moschata]
MFRPHPHKLVGKEGCKNGIYQTNVVCDRVTVVQFTNLGVQCVKKTKVEESLKVREVLKVDPFNSKSFENSALVIPNPLDTPNSPKNDIPEAFRYKFGITRERSKLMTLSKFSAGFGHRNQPTSIDLNTVRLCFQVFLEGDTPGRFSVPLTPVVSEPIYDKKAMSDLSIIKLSDCVSYVDGGRRDIILLCEKVAKEDIQVRFFEENGDWEAFADFQPSQVHKQHAIWFRTPRYKTLDVTEPVKAFIQLRRPSDGATSEPPALPANYNLFNTILANDAKLVAKRQLGNVPETNEQEAVVESAAPAAATQLDMPPESAVEANNNQSNVAELDEIYSSTQARLLNESLKDVGKPSLEGVQDESFDDSKTYSSLQLAFQKPHRDPKRHGDRSGQSARRRVSDGEQARERAREIAASPSQTLEEDRDLHRGLDVELGGQAAGQLLAAQVQLEPAQPPVSRSQSFNLQRPKSQSELLPPGKRLPPTPNCSTLPNPKKRGFLSKLFGRKSKTPGNSREPSVAPSTKSNAFASTRSLQVDSGLAKSSGNISTHSASSIRIPLKDSPPGSNQNLAAFGSPDIVQNALDVNDITDTEVEHYALYTTMAPRATESEFDEMSFYYAPVEGGRLLTSAEVLAKLYATET